MGWSSGSYVMEGIIEGLNKSPHWDMDDRVEIYKVIIPVLEDQDWDNAGEIMGMDKAYDEALRFLHPGYFEIED